MVQHAGCMAFLMLLFSTLSTAQSNGKAEDQKQFSKISMLVLPQNFYTEHLGFFCRKELQMQKAIPIQLFVRLGSKEYVDRLEGKNLSLPLKKSVRRF